MEIVRMSVGPLQANAYLLLVGEEAVVVDPGAEGGQIAAELARRGKRLNAVWLTHAHFDHVGGVAELLQAQGNGTPVLMHPADKPLLAHAVSSAARWGIDIPAPPQDTVDLEHGALLSLGDLQVRALHTPGHAPGHIAFHLPEHGLVLSGDALFQGSIGRTDLPLADHGQLLESIRRELLSLPDATTVLPGHGPTTTIEAERFGNPFL